MKEKKNITESEFITSTKLLNTLHDSICSPNIQTIADAIHEKHILGTYKSLTNSKTPPLPTANPSNKLIAHYGVLF